MNKNYLFSGIVLFCLLIVTSDLSAQKRGKRPGDMKATDSAISISPDGKVTGQTKSPAANMSKPAAMGTAKKIASVEGITEYQLDNGLKVLLYPDNSKQTITVNITYLVGSRHEGYGETGMAHLLEHMVFKGTPNHPDIPNELTKHGARPNGTTWYDRTNYFETFSASEENLRWALDLESDRMINSFIAKKDLDKEMSVVRNEFEMGENDPSGVLLERVLSTAFLWQNYGQSTIGARSDIENVPIERLQDFYRKYYQPDNAVLTVAGKINEEKTLQLVTEYFGKLARPTRQLIPTYTAEPTQDGERSVTLRRVGDVQAVACMYHIPPGSHPHAAAMDVLTEIMTADGSGRMYKSLIETKKASSQFGWCATLKEPGFTYFGAQVRKESSLEEAKNTMLKTLDEVISTPVTKEEVERAKGTLLKDFELLLRNTERVGTAISEFIGMGDWRLAFIYRDNLRNTKPEDVQLAAISYLKPSNRTIGLFYPESKPDRAEIPTAPDIASLVSSYKGDAPIAQGEDFDPSPTNIEKRTKRGQEPNSIKYALLPKLTKGNLVNASVQLRLGDEKSLNGKSMISDVATEMLDRGTTTKTRQEIKDAFDRLKARVNFYGGGANVNASIQTTRENLPEVLRLVADVLKNPAYSQKEFEELKNERLAQIEEMKSDPQSLVSNAYSRHLNPYPKGDPRYVSTPDEEIADLKNLQLQDVKDFHKNFYGATNATMAVVGDFDEAEIKSIIHNEFSSWKSATPYKHLADPYVAVKPTNINLETPDKANAMFLAGCNLEIKDSDPDYAAMLLGNYILGGCFLNSRLATRIRQKEGLSYGVGSQFNANAVDKSGGFTAYAIYAPENRDKLEQAFKEEIERMLKDGFTEQELNDARNGMLQSRQVSRSQDNQLASMLNNMLDLDRTLQFTEQLENQIRALKVDDLNAAMRKHVDINKISFFKGGDFANKLKKP